MRLRGLMSARGWSEYHLAKVCGLSESTIINVYRRNAMPSIPTLEAICKGFGITLAQFFADYGMIEVTPELQALFDAWVPLTPKQKEVVMQTAKAFDMEEE